MEISDCKVENIGILTIKGNIVAQTVGEIKKFLEIYIEQVDLIGVILDCQEVQFVDSAGLGLLASVYKTLDKMGKKLALSNVNSRIMETFTLTNLSNIFIVTTDNEAAMEAIR